MISPELALDHSGIPLRPDTLVPGVVRPGHPGLHRPVHSSATAPYRRGRSEADSRRGCSSASGSHASCTIPSCRAVQGLMLRFQAAMERIPESEPARQLMSTALKRADAVLTEGRDRVSELRHSARAYDDLPAALLDKGTDLVHTSGIAFFPDSRRCCLLPAHVDRGKRSNASLARPSAMHSAIPVPTESMCRSNTRRIHCLCGCPTMGAGFDVAARNDGIHRQHRGLLRMRERAGRIRAQFEVTSRPGQGTAIKLRVRGTIAFEAPANAVERRLWLLLGVRP